MNDIDTEKLKNSAMFNLSLSSKELFHSNFIAWLISVDKDAMSKVFSNLLISESGSNSEIKIKDCDREWNNFDLYIKCEDDSSIIIENKFKSIITKKQLEEYSEKLDDNSKKLLLSLNSSKHEQKLAKCLDWCLINYTQLCNELEELAKNDKYLTNPYHKQLVEDYCCSFKEVSEYFLKKDFSKTKLSDMHEEYGRFREIRLHDIYQKILFNYLHGELERELKIKEDDRQRSWQDFTRGTGLVSLDYTLKNEGDNRSNLRFELQFQYDSLKLMLSCEEPNSDPEELPKDFRQNFFEIISKLAEKSEYCKDKKIYPILPNRKNKEYNRYYNNLIYKNIKLSEKLTFKQIIEMLCKTFKEIIEFAQKAEKNM